MSKLNFKYEFGVAFLYHRCGAGPEHMDECRFKTYKEAREYAKRTAFECNPTIYIIINDKYVFYCHPYGLDEYATEDSPCAYIYSIESKSWGQMRTTIWWREFAKNPSAFLHLAEAEIGG